MSHAGSQLDALLSDRPDAEARRGAHPRCPPEGPNQNRDGTEASSGCHSRWG